MLEQHLDRATENKFFDVEAAVWEEFEIKDEGYETRQIKKIANSVTVGKRYTAKKDCAFVTEGNMILGLYKGDQIEINKTTNSNPTGVSFVFHHLPSGTKYRRMSTDFRSIRRMYFDA
jgi:hypothetical protein